VSCDRGRYDGALANFWRVWRRAGEVDIAALADQLIAALTALGSRCDERMDLQRSVQFLEWL
jgi:hypothetical protein